MDRVVASVGATSVGGGYAHFLAEEMKKHLSERCADKFQRRPPWRKDTVL